MLNRKKEYSFVWFIENYSYCWHKNKEFLLSPQFIADGLEGTAWYLRVDPRGNAEKFKGYISLFLYRSRVDEGPLYFPLKYELSLLAADGSTLHSREIEYAFERGSGNGYGEFQQMNEVLSRRKADYLPEDILSVRCRMWKGEGNLQPVTQVRVRTRIGIEKISFLHVVEGFSALAPNDKKTVQIRSATKRNCVVSSNVYFTFGGLRKGNIIVEITPTSAKQILSKCKISLLDADETVEKCGEADNRSDDSRKDICKVPLSLTWKVILSKRSEYLPDDKLSLLCECVFSTGVAYHNLEGTLHKIPHVALNQINTNDQNEYNTAEKLSKCPSALEDFKSLYNSQLFTDIVLKTKTKSFCAHKNVICARSHVFKVMLTNNMKEKNTDCIQIDDLDDDILQKLLLFLYSDHLGDLGLETATKLYYAADKYDIKKLKLVCSRFLENNLGISTAIKVLILADTHNDSDLKKSVEDFILQHENQVFGSEEWEKLIETNPLLVIKTMHLKYRRNSGHAK